MKRVLIIEDDVDILEALQLTLEVNGYEVKSATRGNEGFEVASTFRPDLIIIDYFLAGSNGATICRTLKQTKSTKDIPVMMTSAHPAAYQAGIAHGIDAFLAKPFSIVEFMDKVVQSMNRSHFMNNGGSNNGNSNHC